MYAVLQTTPTTSIQNHFAADWRSRCWQVCGTGPLAAGLCGGKPRHLSYSPLHWRFTRRQWHCHLPASLHPRLTQTFSSDRLAALCASCWAWWMSACDFLSFWVMGTPREDISWPENKNIIGNISTCRILSFFIYIYAAEVLVYFEF